MLTKFYRKNTSADATGAMFTAKEGVITKVIIFNDNQLDSTIKLFSDEGMIFFEKILASKESFMIDLDCYTNGTETIKFYSSLADAHCTINFLEK